MTFANISRRKLLGTTAAGVSALSLAPGSLHAGEILPKAGCGHGKNHTKFSKTLGRFVVDPMVAEEQKNMALRTAACPECGVHLSAA